MTAPKFTAEHGGDVLCVDVTGQYACSGGDDSSVKLWKIPSGDMLWEGKGHRMGVHACAIAPDNMSFASGGRDATIRIFDISTGKEVALIKKGQHKSTINTLAFSPDGAYLLSASNDGIICAWDRKSGEFVKKFEGHSSPVVKFTFAADGSRMISAENDGKIIVWDFASGASKSTHEIKAEHMFAVHAGKDGKNILAHSNRRFEVFLRDLESSKDTQLATPNPPIPIHSVAISDGGYIVGASNNGTVVQWNPADGSIVKSFTGMGDGEGQVTTTGHFGQYVVSGTNKGKAVVWQAL